jgi:hypothetical protein
MKLILLAFALTACLDPQIVDGQKSVPRSGVSSIEGIVFDSVTTLPIGGAQVSIDGNIGSEDVFTDEHGYFGVTFQTEVSDSSSFGIYISKSGFLPLHKRFKANHSIYEIAITSIKPKVHLRDEGGASKGDTLFVNYLRLFGAYQVPIVLANQLLGPEANIPTEGPKPQPEQNYFANYYNFEPQVPAFWHNWEYKDARPIRSRVWRELFNLDTDVGKQLMVVAAAGDERLDQWAWMQGEACPKSFPNDGRSHGAFRICPGKYSTDEVARGLESIASKVGFLSIIVDNQSNKELLDVTLHFNEFENHDPLIGEPVSKNEADAAILESKKERQQILPRLKPHQSILWLLSIYIKDEAGYPSAYLSSATVPTRITFRSVGSSRIEQMIVRKPLMDKAAKVTVPFGWYQQ